MEKLNRAVRRHHVKRLKKTRQYYWGYGYPFSFYNSGKDKIGLPGITTMAPNQLAKVVKNPQQCSCMGCGNQRKYVGRSLAEIRFHYLADDQMNEI